MKDNTAMVNRETSLCGSRGAIHHARLLTVAAAASVVYLNAASAAAQPVDPVEYDNVIIDQLIVINDLEEALDEAHALNAELVEARTKEIRNGALRDLFNMVLQKIHTSRLQSQEVTSSFVDASEKHQAWITSIAENHATIQQRWASPNDVTYSDYAAASRAVSDYLGSIPSQDGVTTAENDVLVLLHQPRLDLAEALVRLVEAKVVADHSDDALSVRAVAVIESLESQCTQTLASYGEIAARLINRYTARQNVRSDFVRYWNDRLGELFHQGLVSRATELDDQIASIESYEFFHNHLYSDLERIHDNAKYVLRRYYAPYMSQRYVRILANAITDYERKISETSAPDGFMDLFESVLVTARNRLTVHKNSIARMDADDYAYYSQRRLTKTEQYLADEDVAQKPGCSDLGARIMQSTDDHASETLYKEFYEECVR